LMLERSVDEVSKISKQDILDTCKDIISDEKRYQASLIESAIKLAISKYNKSKLKNKKENKSK